MTAYETTATIESGGELRLSDVPFEPGTQVEVFVLPKRPSADERVAQWNKICELIRRTPGISEITEEDIQKEIADHRAGR